MSEQEVASPSVNQIEGEIEELRDELGVLVSELDRRRHEVLDWRLQLKRKAIPIALGAVGIAALGGYFIASFIAARRDGRRRHPLRKARNLRLALRRMTREPDKVAAGDPTMGQKIAMKILTAAGGAAATQAARAVVQRAMKAVPPRQQIR